MIDRTKETHSLTEFKRNTHRLVQQMKETGEPVVLTMNGKAQLVVQDTEAYQRMLDFIEQVEAVEGIRQGLEDVKHGRTQPAREALEEIRRRYDIPREA